MKQSHRDLQYHFGKQRQGKGITLYNSYVFSVRLNKIDCLYARPYVQSTCKKFKARE